MKKIGFSLAILTVLTGVLIGGNYHAFIDIPSLLMVVGLTFGLSLFKFKDLSIVLLRIEDEEERSKVASWIGKTAFHVGLFSTLAGFMQMGAGMKDLSFFGPAFTVAIVPLFYSYMIYFFFTSPATNGVVKTAQI